jgi:hypothetical protein
MWRKVALGHVEVRREELGRNVVPRRTSEETSKENNLNIVGQSKRPETNLRERESRNKEGSRRVTVLPTREKTHTLRHVLSSRARRPHRDMNIYMYIHRVEQ